MLVNAFLKIMKANKKSQAICPYNMSQRMNDFVHGMHIAGIKCYKRVKFHIDLRVNGVSFFMFSGC